MLLDLIEAANKKLKSANLGATIEKIGNRLYITATFPPKPNSQKTKAHQQRVALGIRANPGGIRQAEKEAKKIGGLLACREFSWSGYQPAIQTTTLTVGDWCDRFQKRYFDSRKESTQTLTTWRTEFNNVFKRLPREDLLTEDLLLKTVLETDPDTRTRKRFVESLQQLASFAELAIDLNPLKGGYSPTSVNPRSLPLDDEIVNYFGQIPNKSWQWAYGLIATFGIRPHELFLLDLSALEELGVLDVLDGKTGKRRVRPLYPEWIEEFNLRNPNLPQCSLESDDIGHRVSTQFSRYEIPFPPYALRHCWAVRSISFGMPVTIAAKMLGHSYKTHCDVYHQWLSDKTHQEIYDSLLQRPDRPLAPKPSPTT